MNYKKPYEVTSRLIMPDRLHNYRFIHEKFKGVFYNEDFRNRC